MQAGQAVRVSGLRALASAPTFPAEQPIRQIDHVLARGLRATGPAESVQVPLSDHRALVIACAPAEEGAPSR
jgi:endonuclease/exonuclease/phosphatase (EEP) superfamily protein YafD